jgi:hypothetical protein
LTHRRGMWVTWLTLVWGLSLVWPSLAGQGFTTAVYEGQIESIRIDKCGLQPGLCEGAIILTKKDGGNTSLDIRIGTWIKRGESFLTIEDLKIGDQVKAQTFRLPGAANPRVAIIEFTSP